VATVRDISVRWLAVVLLHHGLLSLPALAAAESAGPVADTLYVSGSVLTMDDAGRVAEAVAVRDGRILATGSRAGMEHLRGPDTRVRELEGRALLPGFIDPHSHLMQAVAFADWANVTQPPVGSVDSIPALLRTLQAHAAAKHIPPGGWVFGFGYARDGLTEGRELTRSDLDAVFPDNPVMLLHVSGHGAVFNSRAFALAGVDAATRTPEGGVIVRRPGSDEPAGLVMETALFAFYRVLPAPSEQASLAALRTALARYAENGYTTVQDGATDARGLALLRGAAARGELPLDVVALPVAMGQADAHRLAEQRFGVYEGRLKLGGVKLLLDGSPQGRTAWFTQPMLTGGPGGESDWRGKPMIDPAEYARAVAELYARGIQVWTHTNGDAAIDAMIAAHEALGAKASDDHRDIAIHSQFVRVEQLDAYKRLGIAPSFFSNHAFYWGEVHRRNLGEERASFLSPLAAARARGIRFSNHTDAMVTPLDPFFTLWTATNRLTRDGNVLGPEQRIDTLAALRAITIDAAWTYHEEQDKGSIEPGKRADFVILDRNPLARASADLRNLCVMATVKDDRVVYGAVMERR
jgi:predicted amidohydrolase YtcJ